MTILFFRLHCKTFYLEFSYQKAFPTSIRHCGSHDNRPDCQLAKSGRYILFILTFFFFILCPKLPSLIILHYLGVNSLSRSNCYPTCIFRATCKIPTQFFFYWCDRERFFLCEWLKSLILYMGAAYYLTVRRKILVDWKCPQLMLWFEEHFLWRPCEMPVLIIFQL